MSGPAHAGKVGLRYYWERFSLVLVLVVAAFVAMPLLLACPFFLLNLMERSLFLSADVRGWFGDWALVLDVLGSPQQANDASSGGKELQAE